MKNICQPTRLFVNSGEDKRCLKPPASIAMTIIIVLLLKQQNILIPTIPQHNHKYHYQLLFNQMIIILGI